MRRSDAFVVAVVLVILLYCLITRASISLQPPVKSRQIVTVKRHGGRWYMADDGHAVYCYGQTEWMEDFEGNIVRVATVCDHSRAIVKLKE